MPTLRLLSGLLSMARFRTALLLACALCVGAPAAALAKPLAHPLVDAAPLGSVFKDRVVTSSPRLAHAADSGFVKYTATDGTQIPVGISSAYGNNLSTTVAQSYVNFLDSLDHGSALNSL